MPRAGIRRRLRPQMVLLAGSGTTKWTHFRAVTSITKASGEFEVILANADRSLTDTYELFEEAIFYIGATRIFIGRIEEIEPRGTYELRISGRDYLNELQGEYIIESYGITQTASNNPSSGSDVVINISDTTGFEVGDEVKVSDSSNAERADITAVSTHTSITVDSLDNSYTTPDVRVGRPGWYIVDDLVTKYGASMTRTGIPSSSPYKFIKDFKGVTANDAIQEIATAEEYEFGHDTDRDFFYQTATFEDSGQSITLGTDSVIDFDVDREGRPIINRVDVYGATIGGTQIAVRVEDPYSQNYYNVIRGHTIINENIQTEDDAEAKGNAFLSERAWKIETSTIKVRGYETLEAGQLVTLSGFEGLTDGQYLVMEKIHEYPPGTTTLKVSEYKTEFEDLIVDLIRRMRLREKEALDSSVTQVKMLNFYEEQTHQDSLEIVQVDINDGLIAGHKVNGVIGRGYNGEGGTQVVAGRYQTEAVIYP